jgi:hypothetical protein
MCFLFFFVEVTEDDDLTIVGRPQEITIELAEETLGELEVTSVSWMGSSSSEDEDRSTTRAFSEGPPAQTPTSEVCGRTRLRGILEVMEFQMVSAEGSWRCWQQDFPPWRGSVLA